MMRNVVGAWIGLFGATQPTHISMSNGSALFIALILTISQQC
jgi:hypothetical protein